MFINVNSIAIVEEYEYMFINVNNVEYHSKKVCVNTLVNQNLHIVVCANGGLWAEHVVHPIIMNKN